MNTVMYISGDGSVTVEVTRLDDVTVNGVPVCAVTVCQGFSSSDSYVIESEVAELLKGLEVL